MCGRFLMDETAFEAIEKIASIPSVIQPQLFIKTIYPTNESLVLLERNHQLTGTLMSFGYKSEHLNRLVFNARAEGLASRPMFKASFQRQRCVIPCALFYEWDAAKQKISFYSKDSPVLYMAGIFIESCFIIITTKANESIEPYHHRMPLILQPDEIHSWLENYHDAVRLLQSTPASLSHRLDSIQPSLF